MSTVRAHVVLPEELLAEVDRLVGRRGRSRFFADLARQEVRRRRLLKVLARPEPFWKEKDHPELKKGAAAWVSRMRREDEKARTLRRRP